MCKRLFFIVTAVLSLILPACYAPRPPLKEDLGERIDILSVSTEKYKDNHRLSITFKKTTPPSISSDEDYLLITFSEKIFISPAISRKLEISSFPCKYQAPDDSCVLRFRCPKDLVIYPETAGDNIDIIAN